MLPDSVKDGVTTVFLADATAAFGDARSVPPKADSESIASSAAAWLETALGAPVPVLYASQRHTAMTYVYGAEGPLPAGPHHVGICDALVTAEAGVGLVVRTADCLPVALAAAGVAAMVHAGWRGLAGDILAAALSRIRNEFGIAADEVSAAVGVGVGPCHYRVGDEVFAALDRLDAGAAPWRCGDAVDLAAFAAGRLQALGLDAGRITRLPGCTFCQGAFHSYRRDGAGAGRQWSAIVRTAGGRQ